MLLRQKCVIANQLLFFWSGQFERYSTHRFSIGSIGKLPLRFTVVSLLGNFAFRSVDSHFMRCGACCFLRVICVLRECSIIRAVSRFFFTRAGDRLVSKMSRAVVNTGASILRVSSAGDHHLGQVFSVTHLWSANRHASRRSLPHRDRR